VDPPTEALTGRFAMELANDSTDEMDARTPDSDKLAVEGATRVGVLGRLAIELASDSIADTLAALEGIGARELATDNKEERMAGSLAWGKSTVMDADVDKLPGRPPIELARDRMDEIAA